MGAFTLSNLSSFDIKMGGCQKLGPKFLQLGFVVEFGGGETKDSWAILGGDCLGWFAHSVFEGDLGDGRSLVDRPVSTDNYFAFYSLLMPMILYF